MLATNSKFKMCCDANNFLKTLCESNQTFLWVTCSPQGVCLWTTAARMCGGLEDRLQLQNRFCYSSYVSLGKSYNLSHFLICKTGVTILPHWAVMRIEIIFVKWLARSCFLSRSQLISTIDTRIKRTCFHGQHREIGCMNTTKEGRVKRAISTSVPREQFSVAASLVHGEISPWTPLLSWALILGSPSTFLNRNCTAHFPGTGNGSSGWAMWPLQAADRPDLHPSVIWV